MKKSNIVWLKRDLRIRDHQSFFDAENCTEDYIIIYIFEPSMLSHADSSTRHLQFVYHSILSINKELEKYNREVLIFHAEAKEVFSYLSEIFEISKVFSTQESGIKKTWDRDKSIKNLLDEKNISWQESQRDGIIRGIKDRKNWDLEWYVMAASPLIKNNFGISKARAFENPFPISVALENELKQYPESFQKAGEVLAWKYLHSFCADRGKNYSYHISKPQESRKSCGRISPYLAWGNISIRQVYQFVKNHPNYPQNKRSFNGMLTRLKWHCHFIQKFEMECDYETNCVNKGFENLQHSNKKERIEAWEKGETGFPMVDACMRCLKETGWINFRMRAMLVSVFCHQFDCDWRLGVYHLAKLFLDYEPGIHYTQFQMQAGTTGVNTIRMYNPTKQSQDHDPNGFFIKKWVPELREIPQEFIHEPWKMTTLDKQFLSIQSDYHMPIVDLVESGKTARAKIWGHRKHADVRHDAQRIVKIHTRNSPKKKATKKEVK